MSKDKNNPNQEEDIFANAPDDEDIFANAPDDDSDIFAAVKAIKSIESEHKEVKQEIKKAQPTVEEEDIFAQAQRDEDEEIEQINTAPNIDHVKINPEPIQQNQTITEKPQIEEIKEEEDIFAATQEEESEEEIVETKEEIQIAAKPVEIKTTENNPEKKPEELDDIEIDEEELKTRQAASLKARDVQLDEDLENKIKDIDIENIDDFSAPQPIKPQAKEERPKVEQQKNPTQNFQKDFVETEGEIKTKQVNFKIQNIQPKIDNPKEWLEKLITMIKNPNQV